MTRLFYQRYGIYFWKNQIGILLLLLKYLFIYLFSLFFGCIGSSLWCAGFSLVVACGFSLSSCGAWTPERVGSVVCSMQALSLRRESSVVVARGLSCPKACGILVPRPGIEPASPALEGGFFTTGPPGKSLK